LVSALPRSRLAALVSSTVRELRQLADGSIGPFCRHYLEEAVSLTGHA
jgi:hypothetical protein